MSTRITKLTKVMDILNNYKGSNSYIIFLRNEALVYNKALSDFQQEYILTNHDKEPQYLNKIIKIARWYGEKKKFDWELEFVPEKLLVGYYLGETKDYYHMFVKYRQSQEKMTSTFIPKSALLNPLFLENFEDKVIDFSVYNNKANIVLKESQELGVKFLTTRKKAILAHECGGGKTITSVVAALEDKYDKVLVICPASVKLGWRREINRFVDDDDIVIVEGSTWKDSKFTIINYDILDNFYEIPTEVVKRRVKNVSDSGDISYKSVEKEIVSNNSTIINNAMENSQLFQSKFDLIIIDEAHRLSNSKSIRYKIISDLIKRSKPSGIYELTGTMITNNPMNLYNILKIIDADITKDWQSYVINYCDGKQIYVKGERDKLTRGFLLKKRKSSWYDLSYEEKAELNAYLDKYCKKIWLTNGASNLDELREKIKHIYLRDLNDDIYQNFSKETHVIKYPLSDIEKETYDKAWEDYVHSQDDNENIDKLLDNKKLIESSVLRQTTSMLMLPHTIDLVNEIISRGEKVIVFCAFDNEIYSLQEHFNDKCVVHNGKLSIKEKEKALTKFNEDDNVQILLGNLASTSVGLNLCVANNIVFNSVSWLPADNHQAEYRILRIGQDKDCHIYYQSLENTFMERMFEILDVKNEIISNVIVDEKNK
ncbi:MAG: DEAD/DEAH box helicase [Bacilli bacterium]|nr:DEAD/DEAH box helicase [Bacilli bacterium]